MVLNPSNNSKFGTVGTEVVNKCNFVVYTIDILGVYMDKAEATQVTVDCADLYTMLMCKEQ